MSDDKDIREAMLLVWHEVYKVSIRPELTDIERERVKMAGEILFETSHRVRSRFLNAGPGSTTFSVLGQ